MNAKTWQHRLSAGLAAVVIAGTGGFAAGCGDDEDDAVDDAGQAVEEAGEDAGQAAEEAGQEIEQGAEDAEQDLGEDEN